MPTRLHPRREPRVMAIVHRRRRLAWAVVDPTEIRSTGEVTTPAKVRPLAVRRLVLQEKPTVIVVSSSILAAAKKAGADRTPAIASPRIVLDEPRAVHLYAELPLFAPSPSLSFAARVAISALLTSSLPPRTYAPRRHRAALRGRTRTKRSR